ncbi:MAG: PhzF family phenazine biosynthesis protein [Vampirovibrionales bacterium]|nr:PhzF family phenazine biosynthesis protein [Vampirovibrionales bacterium]
MSKVTVQTVRAFVSGDLSGGNPAGVVVNAPLLSDSEYIQIARKMGYSETAFVLPPSDATKADFKVRFFTPSEEVDLCGHATIATFGMMHKQGILKSATYTQETKAGFLAVFIDEQGKVWMTQTQPEFGVTLSPHQRLDVAAMLKISPEALDTNLPIQMVSTGVREIHVPVRTKKILHAIQPDFQTMAALSRQFGVIGFHVHTRDTLYPQSTAMTRNFAPLVGINEESATGTANGALSAYLFHHKVIETEKAQNLIFEQGYSMDLPSEIFTRLTINGDYIEKVEVGGITEPESIHEVILNAVA